MKTFKLRSFAKINPLLFVRDRRHDGYHNIYTVFQTVSLYDEIEVEIEEGKNGIFISSNRDIPSGSDNLVYRAIDLFLKEFDVGSYLFRVFIDKRIPSGGGMGGGSSNAGAILLFLEKFFEIKARKKIENIASSIGSDIPAFLYGGTVMGLERGDRVTRIKDFPASDFIAIFPKKHYSTAKMYSLFDTYCEKSGLTLTEFTETVSLLYVKGRLAFHNDFDCVLKHYDKELYELFEFLKRDGFTVMLSGSGSTFLIFGDDLKSAKKLIPGSFSFEFLSFVNGSEYEKSLFL